MHKTFPFILLIVALTIPACSPKPSAVLPPVPSYWPTQGWQENTPEENGFDSAKLAEGLQTIRDQGINLHSLTVVRNGDVILDAYFYPYDGGTVHGEENGIALGYPPAGYRHRTRIPILLSRKGI